jgi:hypothetical protein
VSKSAAARLAGTRCPRCPLSVNHLDRPLPAVVTTRSLTAGCNRRSCSTTATRTTSSAGNVIWELGVSGRPVHHGLRAPRAVDLRSDGITGPSREGADSTPLMPPCSDQIRSYRRWERGNERSRPRRWMVRVHPPKRNPRAELPPVDAFRYCGWPDAVGWVAAGPSTRRARCPRIVAPGSVRTARRCH